MDDIMEKDMNGSGHTRSLLIGLLIGGLTGAAAMLLFAPQSGQKTRSQILERGIQLRDQTTAGVKHVLEQARVEADGVTTGVREKAGELKGLGKEKLVEQMDRVVSALDAGKRAVKAA